MPGLDSTGPMGKGAQTGRRMGKCEGNISNEEIENRPGRRMRMGGGNGLGKRNSENFGGRNGRRGGRGFGRMN